MDHVTLLHHFFDALEAGDLDGALAMLTADAIVWHNYDGIDMPFTDILPGFRAMQQLCPGFRYVDRRYEQIPGGAVIQHAIHGKIIDGVDIVMELMCRVAFTGGRIARFEEYVDSAQSAPLVAAMKNMRV